MAKGLLSSLSLLLLLVLTSCYSSHARVLSGCILGNVDGLMATVALDPTLNLALPRPIFEGTEQQPLLSNGGFGGDAVHEGALTNKYRTLVLNVLPKGTKPKSSPSKRHNDFNA